MGKDRASSNAVLGRLPAPSRTNAVFGGTGCGPDFGMRWEAYEGSSGRAIEGGDGGGTGALWTAPLG